jgi:hypothetical protein
MNAHQPSPVDQAPRPLSQRWRLGARAIGYLALLGTCLPPLVFMGGQLELLVMQQIMLAACIAWFVAAPFWMRTD